MFLSQSHMFSIIQGCQSRNNSVPTSFSNVLTGTTMAHGSSAPDKERQGLSCLTVNYATILPACEPVTRVSKKNRVHIPACLHYTVPPTEVSCKCTALLTVVPPPVPTKRNLEHEKNIKVICAHKIA